MLNLAFTYWLLFTLINALLLLLQCQTVSSCNSLACSLKKNFTLHGNQFEQVVSKHVSCFCETLRYSTCYDSTMFTIGSYHLLAGHVKTAIYLLCSGCDRHQRWLFCLAGTLTGSNFRNMNGLCILRVFSLLLLNHSISTVMYSVWWRKLTCRIAKPRAMAPTTSSLSSIHSSRG